MGENSVNLAALLGSRICHDLISPIGAINNGLELLDMAGSIEGPEIGLIQDSVSNAEARIRFFRLAYGAPGNQDVSQSEMVSVLRDLNDGSRLQMTWEPGEAQPRADVRLSLLAAQCLETALPYGGQVNIRAHNGAWAVSGAAKRMSVDPILWANLTNPDATANLTPAVVQFALLPIAASEVGRSLQVDLQPNKIEIRF